MAGTSSMVVSTSSSAQLYSAKANLTLDALLMASLICAGEMPGAPISLFFSMDLMMRRHCLACGVEGAEGHCRFLGRLISFLSRSVPV